MTHVTLSGDDQLSVQHTRRPSSALRPTGRMDFHPLSGARPACLVRVSVARQLRNVREQTGQQTATHRLVFGFRIDGCSGRFGGIIVVIVFVGVAVVDCSL